MVLEAGWGARRAVRPYRETTSGKPGLLLNFNTAHLKDGIRRGIL
jgi:hypothetical protein